MFKKVDCWIKKYSYQWYRSEYKQARSICNYCAWGGVLVIFVIMVCSRIEPITEDVAQWLAPIAATALIVGFAGLITGGVLLIVDKHEKELNCRGGK